jgi:hypothetical protein
MPNTYEVNLVSLECNRIFISRLLVGMFNQLKHEIQLGLSNIQRYRFQFGNIQFKSPSDYWLS